LQLQEVVQKQALYAQEKQQTLDDLNAVRAFLPSPDMAERKKAVKDDEKVRCAYGNL
jgi:hypothetical protein